ncbi:MAG: PKD domain-containing protein [Bacteroidales bacterium]
MKHFNELLQDKLNSFEYPYEEGAWESLLHKMRINKIIRWTTTVFVATLVITASVLLLPNKEITPQKNSENKNNIIPHTIQNKKNITITKHNQPSIQNKTMVTKTHQIETIEKSTKQVKTPTDVENNLVANDIQTNETDINVQNALTISTDITQGCAPLKVKFNAGGNTKYTACVWDFGDGTTSFESNPIHIYKKGGTFKATLTVKTTYGKNITSEPLQIKVFNKPKAIFDYTINNNCIELKNNSKQSSFRNWYFNDSLMSDEIVTVCIKKSGLYNVSLVVDNNEGCSDSSSQKIEIKYNMPVQFADAFTPDGDGINDLFGPIVADYSQYEFKMFIYKKEGKCVFEQTGSPVNWDGIDQTTKHPCPAGLYFYKVIAVDKLGNQNEFSGKINLKR